MKKKQQDYTAGGTFILLVLLYLLAVLGCKEPPKKDLSVIYSYAAAATPAKQPTIKKPAPQPTIESPTIEPPKPPAVPALVPIPAPKRPPEPSLAKGGPKVSIVVESKGGAPVQAATKRARLTLYTSNGSWCAPCLRLKAKIKRNESGVLDLLRRFDWSIVQTNKNVPRFTCGKEVKAGDDVPSLVKWLRDQLEQTETVGND